MSATSANPLATSLLLVRAQELARHGRLKEAQAVLAPESSVIPEDPLVLQALAALVTASGDNLRALRLWKLLLQREPGHAEAQRMADAIELWINRPAWYRYIPMGGAVIAALALGWGLMVLLAEPPPPPPRAAAPVSSSTPAMQAPVNTQPPPAINFTPPPAPKSSKRR